MVFEKNEKNIFFRNTGLSAKPEYPENRETSETFFSLILSLTLEGYKKIRILS